MRVEVVNTDADGTIYKEGYGNLSINVIKLLDEQGYHGLFREVSDVLLDLNKGWKESVTEIADIVGKHKVSVFDDTSVANKVVESSQVPNEMKKVLKKLSPKEMNVFTGSVTEDMCLYVDRKIRPVIPNTKIKVFGTNMEHYEGIFTGKVLELWNSSKRAEKAKELTRDRISVGLGNSVNDIPMLKENTQSYFINDPVTKYSNRHKEGPIVYTDLKSLPFEVNNFFKRSMGVDNG